MSIEPSEPRSELDIVKLRFNGIGIKSGLEDTNEELLQAGFNSGFTQYASSQYHVGYLRGLATGSIVAQMLLSTAAEPRTSMPPTTGASSSLEPSQGGGDPLSNGLSNHRENALEKIPSRSHRVSQSHHILSSVGGDPNYAALMYVLLITTFFSKSLGAKRGLPSPPYQNPGESSSQATQEEHQQLFQYINTLPTARTDVSFAKLEMPTDPINPSAAHSLTGEELSSTEPLASLVLDMYRSSEQAIKESSRLEFPQHQFQRWLTWLSKTFLSSTVSTDPISRLQAQCHKLYQQYLLEADHMLQHFLHHHQRADGLLPSRPLNLGPSYHGRGDDHDEDNSSDSFSGSSCIPSYTSDSFM